VQGEGAALFAALGAVHDDLLPALAPALSMYVRLNQAAFERPLLSAFTRPGSYPTSVAHRGCVRGTGLPTRAYASSTMPTGAAVSFSCESWLLEA
jgi:hypothetical protein